jgi:hypothetical protein
VEAQQEMSDKPFDAIAMQHQSVRFGTDETMANLYGTSARVQGTDPASYLRDVAYTEPQSLFDLAGRYGRKNAKRGNTVLSQVTPSGTFRYYPAYQAPIQVSINGDSGEVSQGDASDIYYTDRSSSFDYSPDQSVKQAFGGISLGDRDNSTNSGDALNVQPTSFLPKWLDDLFTNDCDAVCKEGAKTPQGIDPEAYRLCKQDCERSNDKLKLEPQFSRYFAIAAIILAALVGLYVGLQAVFGGAVSGGES